MSTPPAPGLRELIASTVREVVAEVVEDSVRGAMGESVPPGGPAPAPGTGLPSLTTETTSQEAGRVRVERVRIQDDADLDGFARQLLRLFENPKSRQDLRAGHLRFALIADGRLPGAPRPSPRRIEAGAVTERQVAAAATGESLLLGRKAVLTPLARDKARTLGVHIEKER